MVSVISVSDYRLDDRVLIPSKGKDFSSRICVQTSYEAHSASYLMGTGVLSLRVKCGQGKKLTTHVKNE
jgi:hypothetical protein